MSRWRARALELFPEFRREIQEAETAYLLWFELLPALRQAYVGTFNEDRIRRIYMYADWCWKQAPASDLANCVAVCFYEHLADNAAVRADMPHWLSDEAFEALEPLFELRLGGEKVEMLKRERAEYKKKNPVQRFSKRKDSKRR